MKKFLIICVLILSSCANSNDNKISLIEKQRNEDMNSCEYYGFSKGTIEFNNCLMKLDMSRKEIMTKRKILECESVRRSNADSGVGGFWGGVLLGMRENLACN